MILMPLLAMAIMAGDTLPAPRDPDALGRGIQRTMAKLATSTPTHRQKVKILFYGQSITEQSWWKQVADDLRKRFPNADLEIENRAIGGFASQLLWRPAEQDVYPYYPDLVIFHVYGANQEYEQIIRTIRTRTTAEILMQRDHVTKWPQKDPNDQTDKGLWWDGFMNETFLPETAKKYGCGLADVRGGWLDYLTANKLEPPALLKDGVHLNDPGCDLMAKLIERYLVYRPEVKPDDMSGKVTTLAIGKDVSWKNGKLTLEFTGNRVEVLSERASGKESGVASVMVDGKKPSSFPETYRVTRPQPNPWSPVALVRVDRTAAPVVEDWTLTVTKVEADGKMFAYKVVGSVTGEDGEGTSDKPFVSKSGRVKIEPEYFFYNNLGGKQQPFPVGYAITWQVLPIHADTFTAPVVEDASREYTVTLAQNLPNGKHQLEIVSKDGKPLPLRALRIYEPPIK